MTTGMRRGYVVVGVLSVIALVGIAVVGGAGQRKLEPHKPGWRLVWSDEFAGRTLTPAKWLVENESTFGEGNGELACLMGRPENVVLGGGVLRLRAMREEQPLPCGTQDSRFRMGGATAPR